jgi:uncharacterized membrane protein YeiH
VTASVLGACGYIALNALGVERQVAMVTGFLVTFGVRGLAIRFDWSLPVFRKSATHEHWSSRRKESP